MSNAREYDVVVIGGGPVGENAATRAVAGGLSALLVESERFGGECSYWACMPSKALLRSGHALAAARRVGGSREAVTGELDASAVLRRRNSFTSEWDDSGQVTWAQDAGVEVLRGHGRLTGERQVGVDGPEGSVQVRATKAVVVCTGSVPRVPSIDGLDGVETWGSREGTSAQHVPRSLLVVGAGVVGTELAQAWARLGSEVTLVGRSERPLPTMEPMAGDLVAEGLRADGVDLRLSTDVNAVSSEEATVRAQLSDGTEARAAHLLVATGRRPGTDDVGLETVGLRPGDPLQVDEHGQVRGVNDGWLYAAGDSTDQRQLTHQGKYAARVIGDVIVARSAGRVVVDSPEWSRFTATANKHAVPQVVFTDPQVCAVGRTAERAEREGYRTAVVDLDFGVAGSALQADDFRGAARMVVDEDREVLMGVTFVGQDLAELLHSATIAVAGEVPMQRLWHAVPSFPTASEIWLRLLEDYGL